MDLRQLEMFLAVAENGSFTGAGRCLHVAQSAISRKVGLLEHELGERLLKRVSKSIYLTPAGELVLRYARRIFQDLGHMSMEIAEFAHMKRGKIRLGAGMTACMYQVPPVLQEFRHRYPNIETQVTTGVNDKLVDLLRNNSLDICVLTLPIAAPDLEVLPFCSEEMVLVSSIKHRPLARRRVVPAKAIGKYPLILYAKGTAMRRLVDRKFEDLGVIPKIVTESDNVAIMIPLVKINLGVSILPLQFVLAEVKRGDLHYARIRNPKFVRDLGLVFQKSDYRPKIFSELIELFRASAVGRPSLRTKWRKSIKNLPFETTAAPTQVQSSRAPKPDFSASVNCE